MKQARGLEASESEPISKLNTTISVILHHAKSDPLSLSVSSRTETSHLKEGYRKSYATRRLIYKTRSSSFGIIRYFSHLSGSSSSHKLRHVRFLILLLDPKDFRFWFLLRLVDERVQYHCTAPRETSKRVSTRRFRERRSMFNRRDKEPASRIRYYYFWPLKTCMHWRGPSHFVSFCCLAGSSGLCQNQRF